MGKIVFFGDSFAQHIYEDNPYSLDRPQERTNDPSHSYVDLVSSALRLELVHFGYGGTSWWYPYNRLMKFIKEDPEGWKQTECLVMCLSSGARVKISSSDQVSTMLRMRFSPSLDDDEFHRWCYRHFLEEIKVLAQDKKVIIFPCFSSELWMIHEVKDYFAVCAIDLFSVSASEHEDAATARLSHPLSPSNPNHFSLRNNLELAKDIVMQIENYKPGLFMLSLDDYEIKNNVFKEDVNRAYALLTSKEQ